MAMMWHLNHAGSGAHAVKLLLESVCFAQSLSPFWCFSNRSLISQVRLQDGPKITGCLMFPQSLFFLLCVEILLKRVAFSFIFREWFLETYAPFFNWSAHWQIHFQTLAYSDTHTHLNRRSVDLFFWIFLCPLPCFTPHTRRRSGMSFFSSPLLLFLLPASLLQSVSQLCVPFVISPSPLLSLWPAYLPCFFLHTHGCSMRCAFQIPGLVCWQYWIWGFGSHLFLLCAFPAAAHPGLDASPRPTTTRPWCGGYHLSLLLFLPATLIVCLERKPTFNPSQNQTCCCRLAQFSESQVFMTFLTWVTAASGGEQLFTQLHFCIIYVCDHLLWMLGGTFSNVSVCSGAHNFWFDGLLTVVEEEETAFLSFYFRLFPINQSQSSLLSLYLLEVPLLSNPGWRRRHAYTYCTIHACTLCIISNNPTLPFAPRQFLSAGTGVHVSLLKFTCTTMYEYLCFAASCTPPDGKSQWRFHCLWSPPDHCDLVVDNIVACNTFSWEEILNVTDVLFLHLSGALLLL